MQRSMRMGLGLAVVIVGLVSLAFTGGVPLASGQQAGQNAALRHVVLFKFKDDATKEQVQEIVTAFQELPQKIDGINAFEWGTNNSPEGLNEGFTHCFVVTFKDEAARTAYLPHPAHQAFVGVLRPRLDKVLVVDYFAQK